MSARRHRGAALAVGLIILAVVTLLGLAGAGSAQVERLLAQNEAFRENAAFAASAGIEMAILEIQASADPATLDRLVTGTLPGSRASYEARVRFAGYERLLPQTPDAALAGAHFDIVSTGSATRGAMDRQQARVMRILEMTDDSRSSGAGPCEPLVPRHCYQHGELTRLSWQRVHVE